MIELKEHSTNDLTFRTITVYLADPPVIDVRFTQTQQQTVDKVTLVFQREDDEPWKLYAVKAVGDRVLKNGGRGAEVKVSDFRYVGLSKRPDWLNEIIEFFTPED